MIPNTISHYRILSRLGEGGMGEVYLAEDTKLRRKVALKLLFANFTTNADRLRRFEQEAQAASALNHPNILTIYEVGSEADRPFIATEFIQGETLRRRMQHGGMAVHEVLDVTIQVASALAAAHQEGIVHRDIKPENIMLRADGYIKVLDFGLAKLIEQNPSPVDTAASTVIRNETDPGLVMGTPHYMSPEQARGLKVDARTDIFSLGVVIYEMLAGKPPFEGQTVSDVIVAILEREPRPLARPSPDVPSELERIVSKTLRKDREERYQTIKDTFVDLKSLKQELEIEAKLRNSARPDLRSGVNITTAGAQDASRTRDASAAHGETAVRKTASTEYLITKFKLHKTGALLTVLVLLVVIVGIIMMFSNLSDREQPSARSARPLNSIRTSRLTTTGRATNAAISPDGKYVAYVVDNGTKEGLWIRPIAANSNMEIIPAAKGNIIGLTFSPDNNFIYYVRSGESDEGLYQVSVLGGSSRKILTNINGPVTFAPDGKQFAFRRYYSDVGQSVLMIANADGTAERSLATRERPNFFLRPAWSPDGKVLACSAGNYDSNGYYVNLVVIGVEEGTEKPIGSQRWAIANDLVWLPNGAALLVSASDVYNRPLQIWKLSYSDGEAQNITYDLNSYSHLDLARDSSNLVTVQEATRSGLWVTQLGDKKGGSRLTSGITEEEGSFGISWTPDGRMVYTATAGDNRDLWIMDADGGNRKQLTFDGKSNGYPSVSPDGRFIVFESARATSTNVWRMDVNGSNPQKLTHGNLDITPEFWLDGTSVNYQAIASGKWGWLRVPIDGGEPLQLPDDSTRRISPDGRQAFSEYRDEKQNLKCCAVKLVQDGKTVKVLEIEGGRVSWAPDGQALTYLADRDSGSNVWSQPINEGRRTQLTNFSSDEKIFIYTLSRDGKKVACVRGTSTQDVVLISGMR